MELYPFITINARFLEKGTGKAINGDFVVKMFDKDVFEDDYLGECPVDANGNASMEFNLEKIRSGDSPLENAPDLYFVLFKGIDVVYKSNVIEDLNVDNDTTFSFEEGRKYDLGTFLIETENK